MATVSDGSREPDRTAKTVLSVTGAVLFLGITASVLAGLGSAAPRLWSLVAGSGWVSQPFDQFLGYEGRLGSKGIFQLDCLFFLLFVIPFGLIKLGEGVEWALDPRAREKSRVRAAEEKRAQAAEEDARRVMRQARRQRVTEGSFRFGRVTRTVLRNIWNGPFVTPAISSPVSVGWVLLKVLETTWRGGVILVSLLMLVAAAGLVFGS